MGKTRLQKLNWIFLGVSFVGFLDALYLSIERLKGARVICVILQGCDRVTTSSYSAIFNVPVAYLGMAYYLLIFSSAVCFLIFKKEQIVRLMSYATAVGFLASTWFVYLQIFTIRSICFYCMISATTSTALFVIGSYYSVNRHKRSAYFVNDNPPPANGIM